MVKAERQVFQSQAEAASIEQFTQSSIVENRQVFDEKWIAEECFILSRYHNDISLLFMRALSYHIRGAGILSTVTITIIIDQKFHCTCIALNVTLQGSSPPAVV